MGFVNLDFHVRYEDVDKNNHLTLKGFLKYFLTAGTAHSDIAGYGLNDIPNNHVTWLTLNWKLQVFQYPKTDENIHIRTWCRNCNKLYVYRDYEMIDNTGNRIAICSSKWVLINTDTKKIAQITDKIIQDYGPVEISVFNNEITKLSEPTTEILNRFDYTILRRDLDTNNHVNNLNYVDFALEALPNDIYENANFTNLEVMYKKQCLLGDKIACLYTCVENDKHTISIKSKDLSTLHAIITLN